MRTENSPSQPGPVTYSRARHIHPCLAPLAAVAVGLLLLLFTVASPAQADDPEFATDSVDYYWFGEYSDTRSIVVGDVNGDGDLDLITGNDWDENRVYLNDGTGLFPSAISLGGTDFTRSVAVGDLDGDGDLDIVAGKGTELVGWQNMIYLNDGSGTTFSATPFGAPNATSAVALGDLDGDGDLDIIVGNSTELIGQQNMIYLNGGSGTFSGNPLDDPDLTRSVAVGDLDGDGDLDIVVGNQGEQSRVYLNDGSGTFSPGGSFGGSSDSTTSVALGDVNGDGILDVVAGNWHHQNQVYLNDGSGVFSTSIPFGDLAYDKTKSVALGDLDGDGDLDLATSIEVDLPENLVYGNTIYLNDGTGVFSSSVSFTSHSHSVVLADLDGNGTLDVIASRSGHNRIHFNGASPVSTGTDLGGSDNTVDVAVGDVDGDEDLDVLVANSAEPSVVYFNDGSGTFAPGSSFGGVDDVLCMAVGDLDGDGDLDVVVGIDLEPSQVYLNGGAGTFSTGTPFGTSSVLQVVLGDLDGDGDLDAAAKTESRTTIYLNDGTGAFSFSDDFTSSSATLAVGDLDGDGDLDVIDGGNKIYFNDGAGAFSLGGTFGATKSKGLVLGDVDGDGDLDLVDSGHKIHQNDGTGAFPSSYYFYGSDARDVALADLDGDGDLDMIVGNHEQRNLVFLNLGAGAFSARKPFGDSDDTTRVAVGDLNGDGALDIVVGNKAEPNRIYWCEARALERLANSPPYPTVIRPVSTANAAFYSSPELLDSLTIPVAYTLFDPDGDPVGRVAAYYSLNGGGTWSPAVPTNTQTTNLTTSLPVRYTSPNTVPIAIRDRSTVSSTLVIPGSHAIADLDVWLNITHTNDSDLDIVLESPEGTSVELFSGVGGSGDGFIGTILDDEAAIPITSGTAPFTGAYQPAGKLAKFDGENPYGTWTLWVIDTDDGNVGSVTSWGIDLQAGDGTHVFHWDTFASGVFGQSDNTVLRFEAYPQPVHSGITGTYRYTNSTPGPYQWPYASATTFPFRVRGTQVRVYSETVAPGNEAVGAIVYRLPAGQSRGAEPMGGTEDPFQTDIHGYLQGHGRLDIGDRLVALLPISGTESYTVYFASAAPTLAGLDAHTVAAPGVQALTVSPANSLILFNLDVSLEWDGRNDDEFMSRLQFDLQRASEILYDWTNGQAALGEVTVYHDREHWLDAHVRVYASNRMRPSAAQGGIASAVITDPVVSTVIYAPGQVHMGAVWNRYGEPGSTLGEDWPRTLAHELGHYALYLDDNYLGLDESGLLIPVEGCPGAMSDPYREDHPYDEFHPTDGWLPACERTLSHRATGRSDWETITEFYRWLSGTTTNTGPSGLPLAVTQIQVAEPTTPTTVLESPTFYLSQEGHRVQPGLSARAFLFQGDRLADLGRPTLDQVLARGARPGDRVCVYELAAERLGCETVTEGDEQLELVPLADWKPDVIVSPVTSRTIAISVTNVPTGLSLEARLFSVDDPATEPISLTETTGEYVGVLDADEPALEGYVQVWVAEAMPRREIVTDYALGGNPGHIRGRGGHIRGRGGHIRGRGAPATSADGQVILFGELDFEEGEFVALQAATIIPSPLPWATVVGQAYRLVGSADAPDLSGASISFSYMGSEVPPGEETWLRVYFWDGSSWEQLPTQLDTYHNTASAAAQGEGLYALMSSVEIPLYAPGWNLFAYPVQETRLVTEALQSVDGYYAIVYAYVATDTLDPWRVHGVGAPPYVNTLHTLQFGRGYWISATKPITLMLKGASYSASFAASSLRGSQSMQSPPATYYGRVLGGEGFTPAAGLPVTARVNGNLCGQGQTIEFNGEIVYSIHVLADGAGGAGGCGAPGREVTFQVGSQDMVPRARWDNSRLWELALQPIWRVYLPLVVRDG